MAQLKEDEWPADGEPTTSEQEGDLVKRESSNPPNTKTGPDAGVNHAKETWVIDNVEPDQPVD